MQGAQQTDDKMLVLKKLRHQIIFFQKNMEWMMYRSKDLSFISKGVELDSDLDSEIRKPFKLILVYDLLTPLILILKGSTISSDLLSGKGKHQKLFITILYLREIDCLLDSIIDSKKINWKEKALKVIKSCSKVVIDLNRFIQAKKKNVEQLTSPPKTQKFLCFSWIKDEAKINKTQVSYIILDEQRFYIGGVKAAKPHGYGLLYYSNGDIFEGDFENGNINGFGYQYFSNLVLLIGEWKNNKKHAQGDIISEEQFKCTLNFENDCYDKNSIKIFEPNGKEVPKIEQTKYINGSLKSIFNLVHYHYDKK